MNTLEYYLGAVNRPFSLPESIPSLASLPKDGGVAMIFAPHPDDECVIGALPLRMRREMNARIVNVAMTMGSLNSRQAARREELKLACAVLDFECIELGFSPLTEAFAQEHPEAWEQYIQKLCDLLEQEKPKVLIFPHAQDHHPAHIGTHRLVRESLKRMGSDYTPVCVETEFWHPMTTPNLMLESSPEDVSILLAALACHVGEVSRNPYHIRLPAWMIDNVRRGTERVGGFGQEQRSDFIFATLYRVFNAKEKPCAPTILSRFDEIKTLLET